MVGQATIAAQTYIDRIPAARTFRRPIVGRYLRTVLRIDRLREKRSVFETIYDDATTKAQLKSTVKVQHHAHELTLMLGEHIAR